MLVSQGAHTFAASNDVPICDTTALVAPRCIAEWKNWKKILTDLSPRTSTKDLVAGMPLQDTVGAISCDLNGKLAAGVSRFVVFVTRSCAHSVHSGGLLLKHPGRIGEVRKWHGHLERSVKTHKAAIFGAGCWSQADSQIGVTCSVSGPVHLAARPRPRIDELQELGNRLYVLR